VWLWLEWLPNRAEIDIPACAQPTDPVSSGRRHRLFGASSHSTRFILGICQECQDTSPSMCPTLYHARRTVFLAVIAH